MDLSDIRWPVFVIAQREAVTTENGVTILMDYDFLLKGEATDDTGRILTGIAAPLLFSSPENAARLLTRTKQPSGVVATFRDKDQLRACIQHYRDRKFPVVIYDRYSDGQYIEINLFLSIVERQC